MAELVDAQVSKTCSLGSVGSIPTARTTLRMTTFKNREAVHSVKIHLAKNGGVPL